VDALAAAVRLAFERVPQFLRGRNIDAEVERIRKYEILEAALAEAKQR
jgi:hypothetical protein